MANPNKLLTLQELHQEQPNISERIITREIKSGKLRAKKIGNKWLVSQQDWDEYRKPNSDEKRKADIFMEAVKMVETAKGEKKGDLSMSKRKTKDRASLGNMGYYKRVHKVHDGLKLRTEPLTVWYFWKLNGNEKRQTEKIENCRSNEQAEMYLKMRDMEQFTNQFICRHCGKHMFNGEQVKTVTEESTKESVEEPMTFTKFWEEKYAPNYEAENPNSYGGVAGTIKNYLIPRFGEKRLKDINQEDVDRLRKDLIELNRKQASMNKVLRHFRSILVKAEEYRYIVSYPKFKLFTENDKRERMVLSNEEFKAVYDHAEKYLQPMMIIHREAFCRPGELLKLKWDNVNLEERKITIVESKGGGSREIYFSRDIGRLFQDLFKNRNGSESVFPVKRNKYFGDFKIASENAGFKGTKQFKPHDLRSTGASIAMNNGVDINTIKERGGWANLNVLQEIYLKSNPTQQRKAAEVINSNGKA